ncbi:MAG: nitroreductase family protein [Synergistales bacterium]|nr:nitroreductase family protein [Synergistales bacterium]
MEFLELARARYSVRQYSPDPVPRTMIEKCIEAARLAPSACNSQPWHFLVSDIPERTKEIAEIAFGGPYSMNSFASKAPVIITVVTERSGYAARMGGFFRGVQFSLIDIGIACEHFSLQATEMGLGTCWYGWFNEKGVKRLLDIPRDQKIDLMISLGFPSKTGIPPKKRKTLEEIFRYIG